MDGFSVGVVILLMTPRKHLPLALVLVTWIHQYTV
jgi:hypothetical protein